MSDYDTLSEIGRLRAQVSDLTARLEKAEAGLVDAIECVDHWAEYADKYFQEKHDLTGDLARLRGYLPSAPRALKTP
jgi:hypothetical protein